MLDIKFIRENPTLIREAARKKQIDFDLDLLLKLDEEHRALRTEVEAMRSELNTTSDQIAKMDPETRQAPIDAMRALKEKLEDKEKELALIEEKFRELMYQVPNVPDPSVPDGDNKEIRRWGDAPSFAFEPKDHITLMRDLDLADFERGVKVSGFRGYFLKREAVLLSTALWQYALKCLEEKGYMPLLAPALARELNFVGTGWLPQGRDEIYKTQDDVFLVGTAEVSAMGMFQDEIFSARDLPKKFAALSGCFRREAGSYGKDTKGLYRVHEFMKVEQIVFCRADHMESVAFHEKITKNAEEILQALGLHYRVVVNGGGDLGLGQVKKYDIETWIPSQKKFGETHSASYFHDFQTRRLNIRYREEDGTMRFAHSLNNTAIATPRILINILEQYQKEDGGVGIPEVLRSLTGKSEIRRDEKRTSEKNS